MERIILIAKILQMKYGFLVSGKVSYKMKYYSFGGLSVLHTRFFLQIQELHARNKLSSYVILVITPYYYHMSQK